MTFAKPSESVNDGERFKSVDHDGRTILFMGAKKEWFDGGDFEPSWVANCSLILVLDSPEGIKAYPDALVFGGALAPTLWKAEAPVLGILGKQKTKNGRMAWSLQDADEAATKAAEVIFKDSVKVSGDEYTYAPDEAPF